LDSEQIEARKNQLQQEQLSEYIKAQLQFFDESLGAVRVLIHLFCPFIFVSHLQTSASLLPNRNVVSAVHHLSLVMVKQKRYNVQ
jgi:hypothetical protein